MTAPTPDTPPPTPTSEPTDPEGMYRIPGIEEGRYVMGVQAPSGAYNFPYSILIKSDALAKLSVDLVVMGSSSRWRRQSRFFSPTVDFVIRRAPCEVLVVAFPEGVFQE